MDGSAIESRVDQSLIRFARRLSEDIGATKVLLFGSHARGEARQDSDYDVIIVSDYFRAIETPRRAMGLRRVWRDVGGHGPMDLFCLTSAEFGVARQRITLIDSVLPEAIDLLALVKQPIA